MAQKINPISYRLGIRNMWRSTWCEESKNYSCSLYQDLYTRQYARILLYSIGINYNTFLCKKTNKSLFLFTKSSPEIFNRNRMNIFRRSKKLKLKLINSRLLSSLAQHRYFLKVHFKILKKVHFKRFQFVKKFDLWLLRDQGFYLFWKISASTFAYYLVRQISIPVKTRDWAFRVFGLHRGILHTLRLYFKNSHKRIISGIRVTLAGKWTKTRSGRKQKVSITVGKLNIQTLSSFIDYDLQTVTTKFGVCSIKVLISYRLPNRVQAAF